MKTQRSWQVITAGILLAILGLAMLGEWTMWLLQGNLTDGIYTVENNSFIVLNIAADAVAALFVLVGAVGILMDRRWSRPLTFIGGGMVIYATIIGLGYTLKSDPTLTPMLIVSLVIVLICFALLWSGQVITQMRAGQLGSHI
jgi:hypothetical protein